MDLFWGIPLVEINRLITQGILAQAGICIINEQIPARHMAGRKDVLNLRIMKITTRYVEDELYIAENENGNTINIDMRKADEKQSLAPVEMMLASIAGCAAVDIVSMLRKKRKTFIDLTIETTGIRRDEHPRGLTHITSKYTLVSPDTSLEAFEKVAILATDKYCSAAASVKAEIKIECEVLAEKDLSQ